MLLFALAVVAANPVVPRIGDFVFGQSFAETQAVAAQAGDRLSPLPPQGRFQNFFIIDAQGNAIGSLSICSGRLQHASLDVQTYNEFTDLLRQKISQLGQPQIEFISVPYSDGSKSLEEVRYRWPAHLFALTNKAHSEDPGSATQSFGDNLRCQ